MVSLILLIFLLVKSCGRFLREPLCFLNFVQVGIVSLDEAIQMADDSELVLVRIISLSKLHVLYLTIFYASLK